MIKAIGQAIIEVLQSIFKFIKYVFYVFIGGPKYLLNEADFSSWFGFSFVYFVVSELVAVILIGIILNSPTLGAWLFIVTSLLLFCSWIFTGFYRKVKRIYDENNCNE